MTIHREPWGAFPDVRIHTSITKMKEHPGYMDAKRGGAQAAVDVVAAVTKGDRLKQDVDFVIPVLQLDQTRPNMIPVALATAIAQASGARLWLFNRQVNDVGHTASSGDERLIHQPWFDGPVPQGRCLIVDDVVTYGSTLANLRGHLLRNGATVTASMTLAAGFGSTKLACNAKVLHDVQDRFTQLEPEFRNLTGFGFDCLTNRESRHLAGIKNAHEFRTRLFTGLGHANSPAGPFGQKSTSSRRLSP